ncbi:MAG: hypothetical protein FWF60_03780 [Oscillospiraceae bacterium]|nr:hypothetical protein [Oscillospiraceae bacterium]
MTGTHMTQQDYERLKGAARDTALTDAEAVVLVNREFGFEASKIEILHEAELDATEPGARCVKLEKTPRPPMNASTDWNYIRFNVHCAPAVWYYEMVNAQLYQVCI